MTQSFVVVTDSDVSLNPNLLVNGYDVLHVELGDAGTHYNVTVTTYKNGLVHSKETKRFAPILKAALEGYLYMMLRRCIDDGLVIYHHNVHYFELMRKVILKSSLPYAIWAGAEQSFNWKQQHFISGARYVFCFEDAHRAAWKSKFVYACDLIKKPDVSRFKKALKASARRSFIEPLSKPKKAKELNVLLVSYFMPPAETVAVHRLNYWHNMLPKIAKKEGKKINVSTLTALESFENDDKYIVVRDRDNIDVNSLDTQKLVARYQDARMNYFSAYWADHVKAYFENHPKAHYDCIVISGNPFCYFDLGEYFKEKFGAKVILDFRDPFAHNPRFVYSDKHKALAVELESQYLASADHILSVNKYCLDSIGIGDEKQGLVVANGYDESVSDTVKPIPLRTQDDRINFVYTGSFYADRKPDLFLAELKKKTHNLIHIGRTAATDSHLDQYPALERYGLMTYEEVIGYCHNMQAGIIFTSGAAFEQTTKIFDYIACDIDIIIVTDGEVKTGELHNLTKDLAGTYWVKNNPADIGKFLKSYKPKRRKRKTRALYSRLGQTKKLYDIIVEPKKG
ncbi:MAG: hypothetical protein ACSHXY_03400 [Alphaproteobacteria bacterium]